MITKFQVSNIAHVSPAEVLPHAGEMILLDELLYYNDISMKAGITIRETSLFINNNDEVPAWVGIEYMAQTAGAWSGIHAKINGDNIAVGFLLGTRRYTANQNAFPIGAHLVVETTVLYQNGGMGAFECNINRNDGGDPQNVAQAILKLYRPVDNLEKT